MSRIMPDGRRVPSTAEAMELARKAAGAVSVRDRIKKLQAAMKPAMHSAIQEYCAKDEMTEALNGWSRALDERDEARATARLYASQREVLLRERDGLAREVRWLRKFADQVDGYDDSVYREQATEARAANEAQGWPSGGDK